MSNREGQRDSLEIERLYILHAKQRPEAHEIFCPDLAKEKGKKRVAGCLGTQWTC